MVKLTTEDAMSWMEENMGQEVTSILKSYGERYYGMPDYFFALMADFANEKMENNEAEGKE